MQEGVTVSEELPSNDVAPRDDATVLASDAEREQTVSRLNVAAKEGRMPLEEYSERVGLAYEARTRGELEKLVRDLPQPVPGAEPVTPSSYGQSTSAGRTQWHVSPIGGLRRVGRWAMGREIVSIALIGGVKLDLREAQFASPEVTITKISLIGGVRIAVPAGVRVEVSSFSLLGGRRIDVDERISPGAPVLYIRSFGLIGGVRVMRTLRRERRGPRGLME